MANQEHLKIIKQGVVAWNKWRTRTHEKPDLTEADLRNETLAEADLHDTLLTGAKLVRTFLTTANLRGANLSYANLRLAGLINADLTGADIRGADLSETNSKNTNLDNADLRGANFKSAQFQNASLNNVDLRGANCENVQLTKSQLNNSDLSGALLKNANLESASLVDACLNGANLNLVQFQKAILRGVDFTDANLTGANLYEVDLRNVNFTGAMLTNANFGRAIADEDQFDGKQLSKSQKAQLGFPEDAPLTPSEAAELPERQEQTGKGKQKGEGGGRDDGNMKTAHTADKDNFNGTMLQNAFIQFLRNVKHYPATSLKSEFILGGREIDLALTNPNTKEIAAIIEFIFNQNNAVTDQVMARILTYKRNHKSDIPTYFVCHKEIISQTPFNIYEILKDDTAQLISPEEFPSYQELTSKQNSEEKYGNEFLASQTSDTENRQTHPRLSGGPVDRSGNIVTVAGDEVSHEDMLGRQDLVDALADMFSRTKDVKGLTIALLGNWGEGKSTVMDLLKRQLRKSEGTNFKFANFNAWEYENTDSIAAGLAHEVLKGLTSKVGFIKKALLCLRFAKCEYKWKFHTCWIGILIFISTCIFIGPISEVIGKIAAPLKACLGIGAMALFIPFAIYFFNSIRQIIEHPLTVQLQTYLKLPTYREHLGLVPMLKRHVKSLCRISLGKNKKLIVFVDDLDRCGAECISSTLDAIRLVMTVRNVIVMIGIDHRIAFKAIEAHYKELGDGDGNRTNAEITRDYLGKIVQLPIRLLSSNPEDIKQYVGNKLFADAIKAEEPVFAPLPVPQNGNVKHPEETLTESNSLQPEPNLSVPAQPPSKKELQDTYKERDQFYELANKFNFTNPRQLLRLRNSYRLLKILNVKNNYQEDWLMTMLFWQEFLHNWPREIRNACMAAISGLKVEKEITNTEIQQIIREVHDDIYELFSKPEYCAIAQFVRIVVLPHNQDGVLDNETEIKSWLTERRRTQNLAVDSATKLGA